MSFNLFLSMSVFLLLMSIFGAESRLFKRAVVDGLFTPEDKAYYSHNNEDFGEHHDIVKIFTKRDTDPNTLNLHFNTRSGREALILERMDEQYLIADNTPVWLAEVVGKDLIYKKAHDFIIKDSLELYYSADGHSCIAISNDEITNELKITGIVKNYVIRPLSKSVQARVRRAARSIDEKHYFDDAYTATNYHLVYYDSNLRQNESSQDILEAAIKKVRAKRQESNNFKLWEQQEIVYPKLLINTDMRVKFRSDRDPALYDFLVYIVTFWFSVDLKYRVLEAPKVRLHIAGIIVAMEEGAIPYIPQSKISDGSIDTNRVLETATFFWNLLPSHSIREILRSTKFDIAVTMTTSSFSFDGADFYILGVASPPRLCVAKLLISHSEGGFLLLFIHDNGKTFNGVQTATHELGHLFGAVHDGGPGAEDCPAGAGNTMEPKGSLTRTSVNGLKWSKCSVRQIQNHLSHESRACGIFTEKPQGTKTCLPLPGALVTLNEQCKSRGYSGACDPENTCHIQCYCSGWKVFTFCAPWCKLNGYAWDGSPCGNNKHCINGECLPIS